MQRSTLRLPAFHTQQEVQMRSITRLLVAVLAVAPATAGLHAQVRQVAATGAPVPAATPAAATPTANAACCRTKLSPAAIEAIERRMREGVALAESGQYAAAHRLLKRVLREQRTAGIYPAQALRQLANVEFALDRPVDAAGRLVELAHAAKAAGDPQAELDALVDASILYGQLGMRDARRALVPEIQRLLDSPVIPLEKRQELAMLFPPA
jgi:tetratricopeptide (TPR) repeat protein